jgi:hypothetical protein
MIVKTRRRRASKHNQENRDEACLPDAFLIKNTDG